MLILIEGPDNTGKTTLAKRLCEEFDAKYIHCSKPKTNDVFVEYTRMLHDLREEYPRIIMDRGHLGEYVYSQLWRGGLTMDLNHFNTLSSTASRLFGQFLVVHATAPVDVIIDRCEKNNEELLKASEVERCVELFNQIIGHCKHKKLLYESSLHTVDQCVNNIKSIM